jgi:TolA-binding protein
MRERRGRCSAIFAGRSGPVRRPNRDAVKLTSGTSIVADAEQDPREGYRNIPEEDRKAAKRFFDHAHSVAATGNYDYAIEMFIQGLDKDPEDVTEHQNLREVSMKRKASGGKAMGMFERSKFRGGKDDKQNMLHAEKLLAYDPGNTDHMLALMESASRAGCYDTVLWIGAMVVRANSDAKKPEFNKFIKIKDIYKGIHEWARAVEACQQAVALRPQDMDLQTELKNLGAYRTMHEGKYGSAGNFRESVRDREGQEKLMNKDKDVQSLDFLLRAAAEAEAEWRHDPNEAGKLMKYVDALLRTEKAEQENKAIEVLQEAFDKTRQFRFRQKMGVVRLAQLARLERAKREQAQKDTGNAELTKEWKELQRLRAEEELKEFQLWAENYPTDTKIRFDVASRMFTLGKFSEAIPVFQQVRNDPKYRTDAAVALGRSFLEAGYPEEASETLRSVMDEYINKGDLKSKEMYYWFARAMEQLGDRAAALKAYSQVAQWDFNYRDVQVRIKNLRSGGGPAGSGPGNGPQSPNPAPV